MKDDDIHAFDAPPALPAPTTPPAHGMPPPGAQRRRVWPWLLLGLCVLVLLVALAALAGVSTLIGLLDGALDGWHLNIDGHPWSMLHGDSERGLLGVLGVTAAVLMLLLVLPVLLVFMLLAVALTVGLALLSVVGAVVGAVMLAAGAVLLVVALVSSPVWGSLLLLWLLLRRPRPSLAIGAGPTQA